MDDGIFDIEQSHRLEGRGRLEELRPVELLTSVAGVVSGMTCLDLGSGTGIFALPMAELVGAAGTVYAVDGSPAMLERMKAKHPPPNLVLVHSDVNRTGLDDEIADRCFLAFILHEVKSPVALFQEAFRLLKPGGRIIIVEWRADRDLHGPPVARRISRAKLDELAAETKMTLVNYIDWTDNHYVAVAQK